MVNQVRVLAILMFVQGGLESLMGAMLLIAGPAMLLDRSGPGPKPPAALGAIIALMALPILAAAGLKVAAGVFNLKFRKKALGLTAVISSVVPMFTCYCAPTALALLIYGLIVLLNGEVAQAFEMAAQGSTPEQIRAAFQRRAPVYSPPPPPAGGPSAT